MGDLLFGILILVAFAFFAGTLGVVSWRTERYLSDREGTAHRMVPCRSATSTDCSNQALSR